MRNNKLIKGQSLFEVIIAIFIMALVIVGIVILATNSIAYSSFSRNKTLAGRYAQEAIEWLRSQRDVDMAYFRTKVSSSPYCLDTLTWNTGACGNGEFVKDSALDTTIFKRSVDLTETTISTKNVIEVTVVVSWDDPKGYHESRSVTSFTDIRQK